MTKNKSERNRDTFSIALSFLLLFSVFLAITFHLFGFELEKNDYDSLKNLFFIPLKAWIYPVVAGAMFGIFFRSPKGQAMKFIILIADILLLYCLSTLIANFYAVTAFKLLPFAEIISPILATSESTIISSPNAKGIPLVIIVMISSFSASLIFRFLLSQPFGFISKLICSSFDRVLIITQLTKLNIFNSFNEEYARAKKNNDATDYSLTVINSVDKIIFLILMIILLLAPFAVFSTFLQTLNSRGFVFFADLGKFILFYASILFSYQFLVLPIVRNIICYGIKGETYRSFLTKALPVIATAGTTASSMATLATNIKVAQSLNVGDDMKNKGHNRALMPIGATFNMDGTSISLIVYFMLAANLAGIDVNIWMVVLTAITLSVGTAAAPSASLVMLTSMFSAFSIPVSITGKLLSIIL